MHLSQQNRIADEVVLSPEFTKKLEELVVVLRPFVHWYVVVISLSQTCLNGMTAHIASLNDMMTIPNAAGNSSEDEHDDEHDDEDTDEDGEQ